MKKSHDDATQPTCFEQLEPRLLLDVSGVWSELGFRAASGGGISYDTGESLRGDMAVDANGYPYVVWENGVGNTHDIYVAYYNGLNWGPLGAGSTSGTGIGQGHSPRIALDPTNGTPYVTWVSGDPESSTTEIYLKYWDGTAWKELVTSSGSSAAGGGVSNDAVISEEPTIAVGKDSLPVVAYRGYDEESNDMEIVCRKWTGQAWMELTNGRPFPYTDGGLARYYGGGVSDDVFNSFDPDLAIGSDNAPVIAWASRPFGQAAEIYLRRWDGVKWVNVGPSAGDTGKHTASVPGISDTPRGESVNPKVLVGTDPADPTRSVTYTVGWLDYNKWLDLGEAAIYVKRYDPGTNLWVAIAPGSDGIGSDGSTGGPGILGSRGTIMDLDMCLGSDGLPLMTYAQKYPDEVNGVYHVFAYDAQATGNPANPVNWVPLANDQWGVNSDSPQSRFGRIRVTPTGEMVICYTNLLSGKDVIVDDIDDAGNVVTRWAPYDPSHLPGSTVEPGVSPIDSEIYVEVWKDPDQDGQYNWIGYGPGAAELGGVENSIGEPGSTYNSPPQVAVDASGAVTLAYLHRVPSATDPLGGLLVPRILRYNNELGEWQTVGQMPNLTTAGGADAPVGGSRRVTLTTENSQTLSAGTVITDNDGTPGDWVVVLTQDAIGVKTFTGVLVAGSLQDIKDENGDGHIDIRISYLGTVTLGQHLVSADSNPDASRWPSVVKDETMPLVELETTTTHGWAVGNQLQNGDLLAGHAAGADWKGVVWWVRSIGGHDYYSIALTQGDWTDIDLASGVQKVPPVGLPATQDTLVDARLLSLITTNALDKTTTDSTVAARTGVSWMGDMLIVSSDPQALSNSQGAQAIAYVDAENLDDHDPAVYGRSTIVVFVLDDNNTPNDVSDDTWHRLTADPSATHGPSAYSYVGPGAVADGYLVDQAALVSWVDGKIALFWRQVDPTKNMYGGNAGMLRQFSVGSAVNSWDVNPIDPTTVFYTVKSNTTTSTSEIYGMVWRPTSPAVPEVGAWTGFEGNPGATNISATTNTVGKTYGVGLEFAPSAVVDTTGQLLLSFTSGTMQQVSGGAGSVPGVCIQNNIIVMVYQDEILPGARKQTKGASDLLIDGSNKWNPSLAVGLDGRPIVAWSSETYGTPQAWIGGTFQPLLGSTLQPTTPPRTHGGGTEATRYVLATGYVSLTGSDIYAAQYDGLNTKWRPLGNGDGTTRPVGIVSDSGHAVMPSAFGNGSQFPTISWTDANLGDAGYSFYVNIPYDAQYDINGNFIGWLMSPDPTRFTYQVNLGALTGVMFGGVIQSTSNFDERRYYQDRVENGMYTPDGYDQPVANLPQLFTFPVTGLLPDTEHIYVKRWNANLPGAISGTSGAWEQLLYRDAKGVQYPSAAGTGISGDWAPGVISDVAILTTGGGTGGLESQPVVVWEDKYEGSIYARVWAHNGLVPMINVMENSGTVNDNRLEFGDVYYKDQGVQVLTINNLGAANLQVQGIQIDDWTDFLLTDLMGNRLDRAPDGTPLVDADGNPRIEPFVVPPNGSRSIMVRLQPGEELGGFTHYLNIKTSDFVTPDYLVALEGLRYNNSQIKVVENVGQPNDMVIPFNVVHPGDVATREFQIFNTGTDPLTISRLTTGGISSQFVPWFLYNWSMWEQDDTPTPIWGRAGGPVGANERAAVSFVADSTQEIHKVEALLARVGALTGSLGHIYAQIEPDVAGAPSGVPITSDVGVPVGRSDELDVSKIGSISDGYAWYGLTFPIWPTLVKGQKYWVVLYRDVRDTANYVSWANSAPVPGHDGLTMSTGAWSAPGAFTEIFKVDAVLANMVIDANATHDASRTVYVDYATDAASADGIVAYGGIYHDDYKLHPDTTGGMSRTANPISIVFTANKPDFQDIYVVSPEITGPLPPDADIGSQAVTWVTAAGVQVLRLNGLSPSPTGPITVSLPGATRSRTDGRYVVWEQGNDIWMFDLETGTDFRDAVDLTGSIAGAKQWVNISDGRIVYAANDGGPGNWDICMMDLATRVVTKIPEARAGYTDFFPDIDGDLIAWRETPYRGPLSDPADIAAEDPRTDKVVYGYRIPDAGQSATPFQISGQAWPGPGVPAVGSDRIAWVEQVGGAYQLDYFDAALLTGDTIIDQLAAMSDVPSLDGTLLTWASHPEGDWNLYGYYFPLRAGETQVGPQVRGKVQQLSYSSLDQVNPRSSGVLLAFEESTPAGGWTVQYGRLPGVSDIVIGDAVPVIPAPPTDPIVEYNINFGTVYRGIPKTLTFQIVNNGTDNTTLRGVHWTDPQLTLVNQDTGTPISIDLLDPYDDFVLRFGERMTVQATWTINPATFVAGAPFSTDIVIDSTDWDTPRITIHLTGTEAFPAELAVGLPVPAGRFVSGQVTRVSVQVRNTGLGDAPVSVNGQFYLDGVALGHEGVNGPINPILIDKANLTAGSTFQVVADVWILSSFVGDHILSFLVDNTDLVSEVDNVPADLVGPADWWQNPKVTGSNNWSQIHIDVIPDWDPIVVNPLRVTTPSLNDDVVRNNEAFNVTGLIANVGDVSVGSFQIAYYWVKQAPLANLSAAQAAQYTGAGLLLGKYTISGLDPRQQLTDIRTFQIARSDIGDTPGMSYTYWVVLVVDPDDILKEVNEFNNVLWSGPVQAQPVNHPPTLTNIATFPQSLMEGEDQWRTITWDVVKASSNAADIDGDPINFQLSRVASGTLSKTPNIADPVSPGDVLRAGQRWYWLPAANQNGVLDAFEVVAYDDAFGPPLNSKVSKNSVLVKVDTAPRNDPPTAVDDAFTIAEDTPSTFLDVLANDSYLPDAPQTFSVVSVSLVAQAGWPPGSPAPTWTIIPGPQGVGGITFTPGANFFGTYTLEYTIEDTDRPIPSQATARATITVTPMPDPPKAVDDAFTIVEDSPWTRLAVLANDTYLPDALQSFQIVDATLVAQAAGQAGLPAASLAPPGLRIVPGGGAIEIQPAPNFFGTYTIRYTIEDTDLPVGSRATARAVVTVTPSADPPVVVNDVKTTNEDVPLVFPATDLLVNDYDPDGDAISVVSVDSPTRGTVSLVGGTITYTPSTNFNSDTAPFEVPTFRYTVRDATGLETTGTVGVHVTAVNDRPTADYIKVATYKETPTTFTLIGHDIETPVANLTYRIDTAPTNGDFVIVGNQLTYTPHTGFFGVDSFTYEAVDTGDPAGSHRNPGDLASAPAVIEVAVTKVVEFWQGHDAVFYLGQDKPVRVSLKGEGHGTMDLTRIFQDPNIDGLVLSGTNSKSILTISSNTRVTVGNITIHDAMGRIQAAGIHLLGDLSAEKGVSFIQFDDVMGSTMTIGPSAGAKDALTLLFDQVWEASITSQMPIASLTATSWLTSASATGMVDSVVDQVDAPSIGVLKILGSAARKIVGDFAANVGVTNALGSATIGGQVSGDWDINGKSGAIRVGSAADSWKLDVEGAVASIAAQGAMGGTLEGLYFGAVSTIGDFGASLTATGAEAKTGASLTSLTAASVSDASLNLPGGGITKVSVGQWIDGPDLDTSAGSITARWIGTLVTAANRAAGTTGDFGADLTLLGPAHAAKTPLLASATIAGNLLMAHWDIRGLTGTVTVKGTAQDSTVRSTGSIQSITLGAADGSDFMAGIDPAIARHAETHASFVDALASIKAITILGIRQPGDPLKPFFSNSNFSAASLGAVSLLNIGYDNGGEPFGLFTDVAPKSVTWKDSRFPGDRARNGKLAVGQSGPVGPGGSDFVVSIL